MMTLKDIDLDMTGVVVLPSFCIQCGRHMVSMMAMPYGDYHNVSWLQK